MLKLTQFSIMVNYICLIALSKILVCHLQLDLQSDNFFLLFTQLTVSVLQFFYFDANLLLISFFNFISYLISTLFTASIASKFKLQVEVPVLIVFNFLLHFLNDCLLQLISARLRV